MNRRYFGLFILWLLTSAGFSQNNIIDEVAWIVGDEAILKSDVEDYRQKLRYEGTVLEGDPYCVIPEQIALQKLYLDQAKIDSVYADEKSVNDQVEMRINYLIGQIGSKEKLEEYFGQKISDLREDLREMVSNQQIIQQMQRKLVSNVKITPSEVVSFYKSIPSDSIPMVPAQVEVQIIAIEPAVSKEAIDEVKAKLRDFQKRVEEGQSEFSTLAILYSEDTESAKHGGELGFMGKGQLVPEFANVAFSLTDVKRVSKIVESEFGYHIIQLIDKQGDRINCRHILLKPKVSLVEKNAAKERLDSVLLAINNKEISFEKAVPLYSMDKSTKNSEGLMTNSKTGSSKFQMQELPSEVAKAIYNLNAGEVSGVFSMVDSKGKEVYAIAKVKSIQKAHKATVESDYMIIKGAYQLKKNQEILENWIHEKQKEIYVKIDEKWRSCSFKYPGWIK
ncbi:MAG: peptidylprolyl isomerase [Paludibacteraceae bacterium]|nr:peptidylprolyl isomerase [Paludibacteraceae bacterium]